MKVVMYSYLYITGIGLGVSYGISTITGITTITPWGL